MITADKSLNLDELNIDAAFKVAWAGILRLEEITYTGTELKKALFLKTRVTRSNDLFAEGN